MVAMTKGTVEEQILSYIRRQGGMTLATTRSAYRELEYRDGRWWLITGDSRSGRERQQPWSPEQALGAITLRAREVLHAFEQDQQMPMQEVLSWVEAVYGEG